MQALFPFLYLVCFAAIAGGAFALMTQTMRTADKAARPSAPLRRHPEAPRPGDAVLYVDLSRERLEELYQQSS